MLQKNKGRIDSTDSTIIKKNKRFLIIKSIINNKLLYKNINTKIEINLFFFNFSCLHKETNIHKYAQGKSAHIVQFIYFSLHYYSIYPLLILKMMILCIFFMKYIFFFCLTPCWPRAHLCCFVRCERVRDEPGALRRGSVWELRRQLPVHLPQRQWGIWSCHQPVPLPG